jgi:hypothetical protein
VESETESEGSNSEEATSFKVACDYCKHRGILCTWNRMGCRKTCDGCRHSKVLCAIGGVPVKGGKKRPRLALGKGSFKNAVGIKPRMKGPLGISGPVGNRPGFDLEEVAQSIVEDRKSVGEFRAQVGTTLERMGAQMERLTGSVGELAVAVREGNRSMAEMVDLLDNEMSQGNDILLYSCQEVYRVLRKGESEEEEEFVEEETMETS